MEWIFKDEAEKEEASVTDLVLLALRLLRRGTRGIVDSMKPVEL